MIGIYKITNTSKRIYIGQSNNIEKRFKMYKKLYCKLQIRLYNSFIKYGVENHKFEILCECDIKELNDKERYYQDIFSVTNKNGMNCSLTKSSDRNGSHSKETKLKISLASKGKIISEETRKKISNSNKGKKSNRLGKKLSEESKNKMSKIILNTQTGIFYYGNKEAAKSANINLNTLCCKLSGANKNNTPFIYC